MVSARLIFDDECGFCTWSAYLVADHGADVELIGFSELTETDRQQLPPGWQQCAHLFVDGTRYSCGEAMTRAYARSDLPLAGVFPYLHRLPGFGRAREAAYRLVANNRDWFGRHVASCRPPAREP